MWSTIREVRENCARIYHSWVGMFPSFTLAQTTDPSVGSWNFKVTVTGGCTTNSKYIGIGVLSHNRLNERNRLWVLKNSRFQKSGQIWGIENVQATRENRL